MHITSVQPALLGSDLEDITHSCGHCGTELIRTVRLHAPLPAAPSTETPSLGQPRRAQVA